ncbi:uncharacterized protein LOC122385596 [Amphibalanus amphitrite]|uniref:uncharacterized protein LOC122385596 n=1 Tax=Amphibalanus amphitrite TaxID=1232801 RepID=UPI001C905356|nr:uncharacterized protein LOC122385596 [Amphibalanus amphitrite]
MDPTDDQERVVTRPAQALKMTEKGYQYQKELKLKMFRQMLIKLEKDGKMLLDDLTSEDDEDRMQQTVAKISRWQHTYIILKQTDGDLRTLLGGDYDEHRTTYEQKLMELEVMRATIESLTPAQGEDVNQKKAKDQDECSSAKSGSSRSGMSMRAQLYMLKVKESQSTVELKTRAAALEEKCQLEREMKMMETQMQELKWKEERHKLNTELKIQQAKTEVIENMEREIDTSFLTPQEVGDGSLQTRKVNQVITGECTTDCHEANTDMTNCANPQLTAVEPSQPPGPEPATGPVTVSVLTELLSQQAQRDRLPQIEPSVFRGDHTTFHMWLKAFEAYIEARCSSPSERLHYLGHYTAGDARNSILGFLQLSSEDAYMQAKKRLTDRYGNAFITANEFKKRLYKWPEVKVGDSKSLTELADFLEQCLMVSNSMQELKMFEGMHEIDIVIRKLPRYMSDSWRRVVDRWIHEPEDGAMPQYPPFSQFVSFMSKEARVSSGPVTSRNREEDRKRPPTKKERNTHVLLTSVPVNQRQENLQLQQQHCVICKDDHSMDQCAAFMKMSLKERQELVRQRGLCGGCLRRGHRWKECRRKQQCEKCKRLHPTLLHDESLLKHSRTASASTGTQTTATSLHVTSSDTRSVRLKCTHSMLVPVQLEHRDCPTSKEIVYALLDPQSDTCFVKDSVLQRMDVDGEEVALEVNTMTGKTVSKSQVIRGFTIRDLSGSQKIELPPTYSKEDIPAERQLIPRRETTAEWTHLREVSRELPEYRPEAEIGILIGVNCSKALKPLEVITGGDDEPWAIRTSLGWSVVGYMGEAEETDGQEDSACLFISTEAGPKRIQHYAFRVRARELHPEQVARMFESDFDPQRDKGKAMSQDDKQFLRIMEDGMHQLADGRFEAPLPLREPNTKLPDNIEQAQGRLHSLSRKFKKDSDYKDLYVRAMEEMLAKGYAEPVPDEEIEASNGRVWYVPHHGVIERKKNKVRVVFDCSTEYRGRCLNRELLQGPDFSNNLVGILTRFRKEKIALTCDIEAMFNRVVVSPPDRNLLRFLWWPGGDVEEEPVLYRMTTHLFGAISSPACAMHALNLTAELYASRHGEEAAAFVKRDFYVDDGLASTPRASTAISLIENTTKLCAEGGFKLGKFASNDSAVLGTIPIYSRSKTLQNVDLLKHKTEVCEQALGVRWDLFSDTILFNIDIPEKPLTRRGILSGVSSVFDPLGLISPITLRGKMIIKELCGQDCTWDDPVPEELGLEWLTWRKELLNLSALRLPRQYGANMRPSSGATRYELHHFSDASMCGYGACSYLRAIRDDEVTCDLVMAKSRVTPKKVITVPRLELAAAVLASELGEFLGHELSIPALEQHYWCDSRVVLGYIRNSSRRFHVYVANRVQLINDHTTPDQWHFISSAENPADVTSRGSCVRELVDNHLWWHGPAFLSLSTDLPLVDNEEVVDERDPEVKKAASLMTKSSTPAAVYPTLLERLERFSSWFTAKKAVANCLRYMRKLQEASKKRRADNSEGTRTQDELQVQDLKEAEVIILRSLQKETFKNEMVLVREQCHDGSETLEKSKDNTEDDLSSCQLKEQKRNSSLRKLDPVMRHNGLLCVGGRIRRASLPQEVTNPVILPKSSHVTTLIIRQCHEKTGHSGREMTLGEIRQQGYWVIHGRSAVSSYVLRCVLCRRLRGSTCGQKMADLPSERLEPSAPFTFCGVDCFGPFFVKERRSEVKRWGLIFTCLSSRAVHLETLNSMSTDSFLNAYRRFVCRRGPVQRLYCDNGSNFVGGQSALKAALKEMKSEVTEALLKDQCDWIEFSFNPPHASHMGGIWERMIRCARSALTSLLVTNGQQLDDELLRTMMCEVEDIVNSRPISVVDMSDTNKLEPLSPSLLLTQKSRIVLPFPGRFSSPDLYARQRWRRIQHLANDFWARWRREIVYAAQERRKWTRAVQNIEVDDIVLVVDDERPRSEWPLARVVATHPSGDRLVRKVRVLLGGSEYERPVHRLVLLLRRDCT